jgi:uncharacterized protein (TIGR02246 family)
MPSNGNATAENEIRELIENRAAAIRRRDADLVISYIADDIVLYDALAGLQKRGTDDLRQKTEEWLGWYQGNIGFEIRDLSVFAGEDVGFAFYLYGVTGTMSNGSKVDMWVRATVGLQKRDGGWRIVHEHTSVPFVAESGKAILDAQP